MTYGPPPENQPGQPSYGPPPQGGYQPPPQGGYQPPPQGGYPQPGQYGPPPAAQYGPPPGQYGAPRRGFDFSSVNPLDWAIMAAGVLSLIFSFFQYYTADAKGELKAACDQGLVPKSDCSATEGAWHGFFGWFGVLLLLLAGLITAVVVFMPQMRTPFPPRLIALVAAAFGVILTFIALFVTPHKNISGLPPGTKLSDFVDFGRGFSYWIVLILAVAATGLTAMRYQQTGGNIAALFAGGSRGGAAPPPGYGYGAPQGYGGQPPGYQQQPGYQQPPQQAAPPQQQPPTPTYQPPPAPAPGGYQPPPAPGGYQPPPSGYQPPPQAPGYQPPPQPPGYQPPAGPPPQQQQPPSGP
jgi:hypothetical protein